MHNALLCVTHTHVLVCIMHGLITPMYNVYPCAHVHDTWDYYTHV